MGIDHLDYNNFEELPLLPKALTKKEVSPEIEMEWDTNRYSPCIKLRLNESTYEAYIANGVFYDGMLKVPEKNRRKGIGSKLLSRLIEIAKEQGINICYSIIAL